MRNVLIPFPARNKSNCYDYQEIYGKNTDFETIELNFVHIGISLTTCVYTFSSNSRLLTVPVPLHPIPNPQFLPPTCYSGPASDGFDWLGSGGD